MPASPTGRFVWYDLLTTAPKEGASFYTSVIPWTTQPWEENYTMWVGSQGPLGGTMVLPEASRKAGPHWISYVAVANVEATVEETKKLGGRAYVEPTDIPKVGRFAVIADPQGASIGVIAQEKPMPLHDSRKPGEFTWNELVTSDHESAFRFYSTIFGWQKMQEVDMGPMGKYLVYGTEGIALGGMLTKARDMAMPPAWLYYVEIADLDAAVERSKSRGARVLHGPMEVPSGSRIVQISDPQGAMFALHELKRA